MSYTGCLLEERWNMHLNITFVSCGSHHLGLKQEGYQLKANLVYIVVKIFLEPAVVEADL